MDAVTPKTEHSHHVRPAEMQWQKTRFPGCEAKTLLFDKSTGLVTALMRFAPGAVLPDHEHVQDRADLRAGGPAGRQGGPGRGARGQAGRVRLARARQPPRRLAARTAA